MPDSHASALRPIVNLTIEVSPPMDVLVEAETGNRICATVEKEFAALFAQLGLPARPIVGIVLRPAGTANLPVVWPRLRVHGKQCRYPAGLPLLLFSYVFETHLRLVPEGDMLTQLLASPFEENSRLMEWFALIFLEAVKRRPSILLNEEVTNAYAVQMPASADDGWTKQLTLLQEILEIVLDQRISIADIVTVDRVLREHRAKGGSKLDTAERLITNLKPAIIEVRLHPDYLKSLTIGENDKGIFKTLREGLFHELGIKFPTFRFTPTSGLKPNSFSFTINHLAAAPRHGLLNNQALISASPADLGTMAAEAAINPANGNDASVVDTSFLSSLPATHAVWSPMGYLILCLAADLREHAASLINTEYTNSQLTLLEAAFPALTAAAFARYSLEDLTRLLRGFAAECLSIRDLRTVLGAALDFDCIHTDYRYIILDDRLPVSSLTSSPSHRELIAYVRMQMKRSVSYAQNRTKSLAVYVLSIEFEDHLHKRMLERDNSGNPGVAFSDAVGDAGRDALLEALRKEFNSTNPFGPMYPLLTTSEIRPWVKSLTSADFPRLSVLSYQELTADMQLQVIGRISPEVSHR
jgi:flagellar biosynthesis component FlhA